jgi:hypothetical protein
MPADGTSLPTKEGDFGTSRWVGSMVKLHQPHDWAEGGMTARHFAALKNQSNRVALAGREPNEQCAISESANLSHHFARWHRPGDTVCSAK